MYPDQYLFSKEHEWVSVDGNVATVGITHHAQDQLGDIVYVELPEVGSEYSKSEEFGSVESVKAVAEVFMPLSGEVLEVNDLLEETPELVNTNPHDEGWIMKIRLTDKGELKELMSAADYQTFVEQESK